MIAARHRGRRGRAVVAARPDADADAGAAVHRLDAADQHRRAVDPLELAEARREIGDAHALAILAG